MPILATEVWRGRVKTRGSDQADSAKRIFNIVGASDEDEAMDSVYADFSVEINSPYDDSEDNLLFCKTVEGREVSPVLFEVTALFDIPPLGYYLASEDPLDLPWRLQWQTAIETVPFDRDVAGNPIVNSARDAFANPPTKTVVHKILKVFLNAEYYDYATYKGYENCVNSDTVTLNEPNGNTNDFAPGTIKVVSIEPTRPYTTFDTFSPICITLEIYDESVIDTTDPFQLHILDQGSRGYFGSGPTSGNIVHQDPASGLYQVVTCDVRLNGLGKPMDSTLRIGTSGQTPVNFSGSAPAGSTIETPTADATYLLYNRYLAVELTPLLTA